MVGHEAVDAEVEEAVGVVGTVDRPDDEAEVEGAGEIAHTIVEDAESVAALGDVNGATGAAAEETIETKEGGREEETDFRGVGGGGEIGTEAADEADGGRIERAEDDALVEVVAGDGVEDVLDEIGTVAFEVEVEACVRERGEGFFKGEETDARAAEGEGFAVRGEVVPGVEPLQFGEGVLGDGVVVELGFVAENDLAVTRGHEIDFDGVDAEVAGGGEGRERVFGEAAAPAAVANEEGPGGKAQESGVMRPAHEAISYVSTETGGFFTF